MIMISMLFYWNSICKTKIAKIAFATSTFDMITFLFITFLKLNVTSRANTPFPFSFIFYSFVKIFNFLFITICLLVFYFMTFFANSLFTINTVYNWTVFIFINKLFLTIFIRTFNITICFSQMVRNFFSFFLA